MTNWRIIRFDPIHDLWGDLGASYLESRDGALNHAMRICTPSQMPFVVEYWRAPLVLAALNSTNAEVLKTAQDRAVRKAAESLKRPEVKDEDIDMSEIPELSPCFFEGARLTRPGENLIEEDDGEPT